MPEPTYPELPTKITYEHPFDNPKVKATVTKFAPEYFEPLQKAARPKLSSNPDELENWEADRLIKQKEQDSGMTDFVYLLRLLYEELYSVNPKRVQTGVELSQGSPGPTPGGLISHFYTLDTFNGIDFEKLLTKPISGANIREALKNLDNRDWEFKQSLLQFFAYSVYGRSHEYMYRPTFEQEKLVFDNPDKLKYPPALDTLGYRLYRLLKDRPEFTQNVSDSKLKALFFKTNIKRECGLAELHHLIWNGNTGLPGNDIFSEGGGLKDEQFYPEAVNGLKTLLFLRTHPQMQIFFQFLSPSGYLNEYKNTKINPKVETLDK